MNRLVGDRLDDVLEACRAIAEYVTAEDLPEAVVHDAVRMRLVEIGEAVRALPATVTAAEPTIPWSRVSRLGERLTRRYFDTTPALVFGTARVDVPALRAAATRLRDGCPRTTARGSVAVHDADGIEVERRLERRTDP